METCDDNDTWSGWVAAIRADGVNLTKWEEDFVESVAGLLERRGTLSERQAEILERIYADRTP